MKIGIIIANNLWFCPYVKIYTHLLDKHGITYDIISWNRYGQKEDAIQFNYEPHGRNPLLSIYSRITYCRFIKKVVKDQGYEKLIIFGSTTAIFLSGFLKTYYYKKYIFDYRDLSIEQKSIFARPFKTVLKNSYINVISSPGFLKYLPKQFEYVLSHNFNIDDVIIALTNETGLNKDCKSIDVLTIGGIRDYESNIQVIDAIANQKGFSLRFVGKGPSSADLEAYAKQLNAKNISFRGYYEKDEEASIVSSCTFMNIFYPRKPSHDAALSNRFYNSLIYKKPMITTANTTQGDYSAQYNVGVAVNDCTDLPLKLLTFLKETNSETYRNQCNALLTSFVNDYNKWETSVLDFLKP